MEQLLTALRRLLADNIALKFKAHGYHWNVESDDFAQLHEFFAEIYEDYDGATDTYAEWLRMLKAYAPYRLTDFFDMSTVSEPVIVGDPEPMIADLYESIELHIEDLVMASDMANEAKQYGLANLFADRQTASQKFCWQLRASMEEPEAETETETEMED
jgi:starvation-inducible DNA-binding protein